MLTPDRLLRFMIELIFVMLGALVIWLGVTGHILFDRRKLSWMLVSAALLIWGLRAVFKPGKWWSRWENWTRGLSLTLIGLLMLAISRVPFLWVGRLLAAAGVLLCLRGIIEAALIFRSRQTN
jgi:hypothetical protein